MCGRYTLFLEQADLEEHFGATFASGESFSPRYNMAPGQELPVIRDTGPETFTHLEWGLVPGWADDDTNGLINARAETVASKPSFKRAFAAGEAAMEGGKRVAGRCLVPANGFYEWVERDGTKQPYRVAFEDDRPFAMAGLWERWEPEDETTQSGLDVFGGGVDGSAAEDPNGPLVSFTILTTEPNDVIEDLHHRMAVILEPGREREWLTADDPGPLCRPYPGDEMRAYPVSTAVNNPAADEPSLVEPV